MLTKMIAGGVMGASLLAVTGALAQDYAPGSTNTVVRNIPITFSETDYGKLVEIMFDECDAGDNTVMFNGPYRRVANYASTDGNGKNKNSQGSPAESEGDARYDYIVHRMTGVEGNSVKTAEVNAAGILLQLGIDINKNASGGSTLSDPILSATVSSGSNASGQSTITVTDTSRPNQILDAGRDIAQGIEVGGFDALMVIKNGTPKTADLVCDMNMWYLTQDPPDEPSDFEYGIKDFVISNNVANSIILFWAAGPSGMESPANVAIVDGIFNPAGKSPVRDEEGNYVGPTPQNPDGTEACPPAGEVLDPSQSCVGTAWTREETTDYALGNYQSFFGDEQKPVNATAFGGNFASYCDPTEPIPDPIGTDPVTGADSAGPSGNACNRNRGLSGRPNITISSTLEENACVWIQTNDGWLYIQF